MLKNFPEDQPWFLQVNFTGPHNPWDVTEKMRKSWKDVEFPDPEGFEEESISKEEINKVRQNYAAMLENIDQNIGLFIEQIKKRGELDNTIIIYSSDHGEMLGDFNKWGKTHPERSSVNIPLVISGPGISKGIYSDALVELQDLTSTILHYCNLEMPEAVDSKSLNPILEGEKTDHRPYQVSAFDKWKMISDEKYKLANHENKETELYNKEIDPWELNNIAEKNKEKVKELINQLNCELSYFQINRRK